MLKISINSHFFSLSVIIPKSENFGLEIPVIQDPVNLELNEDNGIEKQCLRNISQSINSRICQKSNLNTVSSNTLLLKIG